MPKAKNLPLPDSLPWTIKTSTGKVIEYAWKRGEKPSAMSSTDVGAVLGALRKYTRETGLYAQAVRA